MVGSAHPTRSKRMAGNQSNDHGSSDSPGIVGKMSRLRAHSGATAAELREFVKQLRGKAPQEVIGVIAQSDLIRATAMAAVGTVVLMIVFTVLPMLFKGSKGATEPAAPAAAAASDGNKATTPVVKNDDSKTTVTPSVAKTKEQEAADKLGIGETKTLDPKKSPLDSVGDDLFKDVK